MGREYERLFGALPRISAPAYLCERVLIAVSRERIRLARMRLVFSSCTGAVSLFGVFIALRALMDASVTSGFATYSSLILSDGTAVAGNASNFFQTLLESLPTPEIMVTLACLAVLVQSVRVMISSTIEWTSPVAA
jgi:hypothetical protein